MTLSDHVDMVATRLISTITDLDFNRCRFGTLAKFIQHGVQFGRCFRRIKTTPILKGNSLFDGTPAMQPQSSF